MLSAPRLLVLCCVLLCINKKTGAQNQHYIDSLTAYLKGPDDSLKLLVISDLAWEYNAIDVNKAISLSKQGIRIATKLNRNDALGQANADLGTSYYFKRDFDSSEFFYRKAEKITGITKDSMELASLYNKMGALYREMSEYNLALKYNLDALKLYRALNKPRKIALMLNNVGSTYEILKQYPKAMEYYNQAVQLNTREKNEEGLARNYLGIGNINTTMGLYDEAIRNYRKAEALFRKFGWMIELASALNNIGNAFDEKQEYPQAIVYRREALAISVQIEDHFKEAQFRAYLAGTLMKAGSFAEAKTHIDSVGILSKNLVSAEIQMELYEALSKYYFGTREFVKGNDYLVKFHRVKDSLYSAELAQNIALMEVKHNTQKIKLEKAEADAKNLKLTNDNLEATGQRNMVLFGMLFILALLGVLFYLYRQRQNQREEKKRVRAMLVSEEKERTRIARELHDGLGQLLSTVKLSSSSVVENIQGEDRQVLQSSVKLVDEAIDELRHISHNLMPVVLEQKGLVAAIQALVKNINQSRKLDVNFTHDNLPRDLDMYIQATLYRLVQEILNNMLKHAEASVITIQLHGSQKEIHLALTDNGKGFDTAKLNEPGGIGWNNIAARINLLKGQYKVSSAKGQGTTVTINVNI